MEWILNTLFYACLYGTVFKGVKFVVRTAIDIYQKRKATNQKPNQDSGSKTKKTRKSNPMDDFITSVSLPKRRKISPESDAKIQPALSGLTGFMESNDFRTAIGSIMSSDLGKQLTGVMEGMSKIKAEDENTTKSDEDEEENKEEDTDDFTTKKMDDM